VTPIRANAACTISAKDKAAAYRRTWTAGSASFQSKEAAKRDQRTIHGLKVTTVDVSGAYSGMGGPMAEHGAVPKPNYRLLGAIIEGPQGSVFLNLRARLRPWLKIRPPSTNFLALPKPVIKRREPVS